MKEPQFIEVKSEIVNLIEANAIFNDSILNNVQITLNDGQKSPFYMGEYDFVPDKDEQVIECKNRNMLDNIRIEGVRIYKVSNPSGGYTIYIDKEIKVNG